MYGGLDKYGGGIVGAADDATENLEDAMISSSIEETLIVPMDVGNGHVENVLLVAKVNPEVGTLVFETYCRIAKLFSFIPVLSFLPLSPLFPYIVFFVFPILGLTPSSYHSFSFSFLCLSLTWSPLMMTGWRADVGWKRQH